MFEKLADDIYRKRFYFTAQRIIKRKESSLDKVNVRDRLNGLRSSGEGVEVTSLGLGVLSLQQHASSSAGAHRGLDGLVLLSAGNNLRLALGGLGVRSGNVKLLSDDATIHLKNKR